MLVQRCTGLHWGKPVEGLEGLREDHLMLGSGGVGAGADPETDLLQLKPLLSLEHRHQISGAGLEAQL